MIDYFKNSIFLTEKDKEVLNVQLNSYIEYIGTIADSSTNVYLTGSLARKEPATAINNGERIVVSDLDFIFFCKDGFENNSMILNLSYDLNKKFPQYKTSILTLNDNGKKHVGSNIGRDLKKGLNNPVIENYKQGEVITDEVSLALRREVFLHQIVCVYLTEWPHKAAAKKAIYKMIIEALRAQCNDESFPSTYRELYERRHEKQFLHLCSAETIEHVIRARELGLSYRIFDKYEFVIKAAATLWGIGERETKDKTKLKNRVAMELYAEIENCEVLLNLYQMAALVFSLFVESRDVIWSNLLDKACDKMAELDSKLNYSHKVEMIDMQTFLESAKEKYSNGLTWKNLGENLSPDSVMNKKKRVNKDL